MIELNKIYSIFVDNLYYLGVYERTSSETSQASEAFKRKY